MSCRKDLFIDRTQHSICSFYAATVSNSSMMVVQNYHLLPYRTVRLCAIQRRFPANSNNWRSEDCIVLSFISESCEYRLKEEAPDMDVRCKFR
ncbi:hypothetical protein T03_4002 [Trichinella britovi]|uniref:Uncharacterized protein n=1 Tax=Trichinella britovi TaxID=45882 RepID=A0A0V1C4H9_TRIBR|nr:hypothetical protein T03_4002 [Trichinella britovi]